MKKKLYVVMMGLCFLLLLGSTARADLVARWSFDDGTANDESGNNSHGTLVGTGATVVADAERGQVLNLDGTVGSYMRVANTPTLNAVAGQATIAMWVYWTTGTMGQLIEKGGTTGGAWYMPPWGVRREAENTLRLNWGNQTPEVMLNSSPIPLSTWTHVAVVYDSALTSDHRKFYINGVLDTHSNWTGTATTNTYDLFIGTDYYNSTPRWPFNGRIDDIQIFNTALTQAEINNVMMGTGVTNVYPESGAKYIPIDVILSWDPPAELEPNLVLTGYDVYFDANDLKVRAGDSDIKTSLDDLIETFDPSDPQVPGGLLRNAKTYFWRVDIVGQYDYATEPNTFEGSVLSFTTVSLEPTITVQPLNQVRGWDAENNKAVNGKPDAVLSVTAVNATHYQWYKEAGETDIALSDGGNISGAMTDTLTITGVQLSDEGQYYCAVSNTDSPIIVNSNTVWVEFARQTSNWSFDNDYVDSWGGYNGSVADVNSTPTFVSENAKEGTHALSLDGIDDYLLLPPAALSRAGTEMTFSFWAKNNTPTVGTVTLYGYADVATGNRIINIHTPWSNNTAYLDVSFAGDTAGTPYDRVGSASGLAAVNTTEPPYWIHWIMTKDQESGIMRVYRNGVQIGQATNQLRRYYGAEHLQLGAGRSATNALQQFFNGQIDDLQIYNYYMDEVEAAYLYYDANNHLEPVCINENDTVVATYDFNDNCKIDLPDLAELAANWLHCQRVPDCVDLPL